MGSSVRPTGRTAVRGLGALSAAVLALTLTACDDGDAAATSEGDGEITVVASTDVYADLAASVVGDRAEVEAIVDDAAVDPHSYEATPQDRLRVEQADVLIANGGGYDPFLTDLASSAGRDEAVLRLIEGEGSHAHDDESADEDEHRDEDDHDHAHDGDETEDGEVYEDEHVWYDLDQMHDFVLDFAEHMAQLDEDHAEDYRADAQQVAEEIAALSERAEEVQADGLSYLATEPVSQHLLQHMGFDDATDPQFLAAVEHGDDVSPRLHQQALSTASSGRIDLLAYSIQTETSQSRAVRAEAEDAEVPVLEFSETIPEDYGSYTEWMSANIEAVEAVVEETGE